MAGRRILVVEDEALVAMSLEDMLLSLGCVVVGPALRLTKALELASVEQIDGAVLDINLGDVRSFPVAEMLTRKSVPFLFATGYGHLGLEPPFAEAPVLTKPYSLEALAQALAELFG
ncbi:MAG TPA: response regulator [Allosphingosinicella sp.]